MKIFPNQTAEALRVGHVTLKVFGPVVSGVKGLGRVLLKAAGQAALPKLSLSMRRTSSLAQNALAQSPRSGSSALSVDPIAVLEEELRELSVSPAASDVSEDFPPEAKALEQHVLGEVKRWHLELFKQHDLTTGRIPSHLKEEKAQSLYAELIDSNDFAKANPQALVDVIKHIVSIQPDWEMFHHDDSPENDSIVHDGARLKTDFFDGPSIMATSTVDASKTAQAESSNQGRALEFDGGYLKKSKHHPDLPFSLVKTTTGKVYELLNTLNPEAKQALMDQPLYRTKNRQSP